jgi:uncharacterized protein YqhQ
MKTLLLQALAKPYLYGGQAVMEGVMMRGARTMAVAVRKADGGILVHEERLRGWFVGPIRNVPLVRGVLVLAETLVLGMRALIFSTNAALEDEGESEIGKGTVAATLAFSLTFIAAIFFIAPLLVAGLIDRLLGTEGPFFWIFEGVLRMAMFLGYVSLIGMLPDIRRTFAYHAAEHRTIHAHENAEPLVVDRVRPFPNAHPRCGTGISRVALIPVIAAIAYELVRFSAAFWRFRVVRMIFHPNLVLQSFTTRNPEDDQIEVAIAALAAVLAADRIPEAPVTDTGLSPALS